MGWSDMEWPISNFYFCCRTEDTEPDFIDTEEEQPAVVKPSEDGETIAQISAIVKEYSNDKAARLGKLINHNHVSNFFSIRPV